MIQTMLSRYQPSVTDVIQVYLTYPVFLPSEYVKTIDYVAESKISDIWLLDT